MPVTLAFDVYGTLINTQGVLSKLQQMMGEQALAFSNTWRDKQLEYSFRRGLMKQYQNFGVCTAHALDYCCAFYKVDLTQEQKSSLLATYKTLPAFNDVKQALEQLKAQNHHLYAFSNGSAEAVEMLLETAGIRELFVGVVSADDIQTFKPDPAVYQHLLSQTRAQPEDTWLISSNPFDVIGSLACDLNAAWVQRSPEAAFNPWGIEPTIRLVGLMSLLRSYLHRSLELIILAIDRRALRLTLRVLFFIYFQLSSTLKTAGERNRKQRWAKEQNPPENN